MIIAGIDPGVQRAGYAILELQRGVPVVRELGVWDLLRNAAREAAPVARASSVARASPGARASPVSSAGGRASPVSSAGGRASPVSSAGGRASIGSRLELLHQEAHDFFTRWNPSLIGLEKAVSFKNVSSAFKLSEARGVVRLAAHQLLSRADERLWELSPTAVKKQTAGWGASNKEEVLKSLSLRFAGLDAVVGDRNLPFDAYDALAIAWTTWVLWKSDPRRRAGLAPEL